MLYQKFPDLAGGWKIRPALPHPHHDPLILLAGGMMATFLLYINMKFLEVVWKLFQFYYGVPLNKVSTCVFVFRKNRCKTTLSSELNNPEEYRSMTACFATILIVKICVYLNHTRCCVSYLQQVSTNKLTFIDLEVRLRDKNTTWTRVIGKNVSLYRICFYCFFFAPSAHFFICFYFCAHMFISYIL